MKLALLITHIVFIYSSSLAQSKVYEFQYQEMELDEAYIESLSSHPFGEPFTNMMQLLKEYYVYEEKSNISGTTSKTIQKASIFYSVKKANKYLLKSVRKKTLSEEAAEKDLERVLTVALNIRHQNTQELEKVLYKIKDPEQIIEFYQKNITWSE